MNDENKKVLTISFVALSLLVGFVTHLLMLFLAQSFSFFTRIESNEVLSNGIPVILGAVTFACLQFNKTVLTYSEGVVSELMKVVWPSRKDTGVMTIVVVVTLLFSGIVIGVYDTIWAYVINSLLK